MDFKSIPGYSKYRISSCGKILNSRGYIHSPYTSGGYEFAKLSHDDGKRYTVGVHRLVAMTHIGPIPKGMWVNHENGIKSDNRVENLRIDTPSYNQRHAYDVLKRRPGYVKPERAEAMKVLYAAGWSHARIAELFGCSAPNVTTVLSRLKKKELAS